MKEGSNVYFLHNGKVFFGNIFYVHNGFPVTKMHIDYNGRKYSIPEVNCFKAEAEAQAECDRRNDD